MWDIMNLFDVCQLTHVLHRVTQCEASFIAIKMNMGGQPLVEAGSSQKITTVFDEADTFFKIVGLRNCIRSVEIARHSWNRTRLDVSAACEILHRLKGDIIEALRGRHFLMVSEDRLHLLPHVIITPLGETPSLGILEIMGAEVKAAFPSAMPDVLEVGNCLAAECNTAAVFHLMRVAEVGLRALASDR